ncbi:condensation domain-containing protein [Actinokineospora sp. 24-640]
MRVTFSGAGSGSGPVSWGQREVWGAGQAGRAITLGGTTGLAEGTTVADVADVLGYVLTTHPSLRTRFETTDGALTGQEVADAGEVDLAVIDTDGDDPETTASALARQYDVEGFDPAEDLPVRMAVVRHRGRPTHVVAVYNHLALDASGLDALLSDLATRRGETGTTPLAQARWQSSPAGRAASDRALRHWAALLREIPARRFTTHTPGYRRAVLSSPAADAASRIVAARLGADSGSVLLAAFSVAVARMTGQPRTVPRVVVGNRFRGDLASSVSAVSQFGLCAVDTAAAFPEVVSRAWRASLFAYKTAYHDPVHRRELIARTSRERGRQVHLDCLYNDRRRDRTSLPSTVDLRALAERGGLRWADWPFDPPDAESLYLHIDDGLDLTLCGSLPADDMETCLRTIEHLLIEAAGPGASPPS